ncbi:MAG: hypothetical protein IJ783_00705 [Kiritimatiellae bacterium]|nr:hypothetical protein [Kiritimatiellia bacterium]
MSRKKHRKNQEKRNASAVLRQWQLDRLERDRELPRPAPGPSEVSVVAYWLPQPGVPAAETFPFLECAIREAWRQCGFLHTVVVAPPGPHPELEEFAAPYGIHFEIQREPSLDPARPETAEADANARLHERFATPWALLVREDGFPLRPGIGSFLDDWDFVGAPRARDDWWHNMVASLFATHLMDGGFSLRSRRLCEAVAAEWASRCASRPWRPEWESGRFCTRELPRRSLSFRSSVRLPMPWEALRFSWDATGPFKGGVPPFGFRGARAFKWLLDNGRI